MTAGLDGLWKEGRQCAEVRELCLCLYHLYGLEQLQEENQSKKQQQSHKNPRDHGRLNVIDCIWAKSVEWNLLNISSSMLYLPQKKGLEDVTKWKNRDFLQGEHNVVLCMTNSCPNTCCSCK